MRGIALRRQGHLRRAAESYQAADDICEEFEDMPNWAVAQANFGKPLHVNSLPMFTSPCSNREQGATACDNCR